MSQANKKFVNIKVENKDSVELKKFLFNGEMSSIKMLQAINRYRELRMLELSLKEELDKKVKELKKSLEMVNLTIPKVSIDKRENKDTKSAKNGLIEEEKEVKIAKSKSIKDKRAPVLSEKSMDSLEMELEEIKKKLNSLETGEVGF